MQDVIYFPFLIYRVVLTFIQARILAPFLNVSLKSNNSGSSGLSSITSYFKKQKSEPQAEFWAKSSLIFFTGLLNAHMNFHSSYILIMPTALLICMENTFWSIRVRPGRGGNFVELFKKSFKLYVESGTREKMEAAINILINDQDGCLETEDFKAKFYIIISEHYLRKIHCFNLHLTHLTTFTEIQPIQKRKRKSLLSCRGWS